MVTRVRFPLLLLMFAVLLTFLFWWPLYGGAGFIGGDLYPYFFPQKTFYADHLKQGKFPLWNDLAGFGYPVLGESQTGAAYPFHLMLYRCLDVNTAYNVEHLLHYIICFVATALFAKRLGLTSAGSGLAALVFTYGWFPPRACLEWAILTGAWLPVALWCVESFLQTRWWRYAIGLSIALGLQLLAGHFHLAFITQLLVATYFLTRLLTESRPANLCATDGRCRKRATLALVLAGIAGMGLASVQLLPSWELKQRSSRIITGGDYDPAYGHMPPLYASQLVAPWLWYSPLVIDEENLVRDLAEFTAPWHWFGTHQDLDQAVQQSRWGALTNGTNKVEAHVYCGVVPLLMACVTLMTWLGKVRTAGLRPASSGSIMTATTGYWLVAGCLGLIYATGWLLPIGRHIPGFSFFRGPGRYGIVTTLAISLLAGQSLSQLSARFPSRLAKWSVLAFVFSSTCGDLWLVSRMVKYSYMVSRPAIAFREQSDIRQRLLKEHTAPRLLAPGPNVANLLGVSSVPWYLGISPEEYVDPQLAMPAIPKPLTNGKPTPGSPELLEWLSRSGVTHVLNFEPLDETTWQVELVWKGVDPFLNRIWGRPEPIYLYRFQPSLQGGLSFPGRVYTRDESGRPDSVELKLNGAETRQVMVEAGHGPSTLILTELAYPGWTVQRNGAPVEARQSGIFRAVECPEGGGEFVWTYRPASVFYGALISLATMFILAAAGHIRYWHPRWTQWGNDRRVLEVRA